MSHGQLWCASFRVNSSAVPHLTLCICILALSFCIGRFASPLCPATRPYSQSDADGMLPLHYASWYGHPLCCQALLAANAEVDAFDHDGRSLPSPTHLLKLALFAQTPWSANESMHWAISSRTSDPTDRWGSGILAAARSKTAAAHHPRCTRSFLKPNATLFTLGRRFSATRSVVQRPDGVRGVTCREWGECPGERQREPFPEGCRDNGEAYRRRKLSAGRR